MNRNDILDQYKINTAALLAYGFTNENNVYVYKKSLNITDFYIVFKISEVLFEIKVFDLFDEEYVPFNIQSSNGSFVSNIKKEADQMINDIIEHCLIKVDVKEMVFDYIDKKYNIFPEYPWPKSPNNGTFKTLKSNKWFMVTMKIPYTTLKINKSGNVDVMNVKCLPEKVEELIDFVSFFPAYHMNKKYWISVLLTKNTSFELIKSLIDESYQLVEK